MSVTTQRTIAWKQVWQADPVALWRARRRSSDPAVAGRALVTMLDLLAQALSAGLPVSRALAVVRESLDPRTRAVVGGLLSELVSASVVGASLGPVWARSAAEWQRSRAPSAARGLGAMASAWALCEQTGAPLAPAVERTAQRLRAQDAHRVRVAAATAGAQASARLLTLLPLAGPVVTLLVGGDPFEVWTSSRVALASLVVGLVLAGLGHAWCRRLVRTAIDGPGQARHRGEGGESGRGGPGRWNSGRLSLARLPAGPRWLVARAAAGLGGGLADARVAIAGRPPPVAVSGESVAASLDLLALAHQAGAPTIAAIDVVARVSTGPDVRSGLSAVVGALRWGAGPAEAWAVVGPEWSPARNALTLASAAGVAPAALLAQAATDLDRDVLAQLEARAGRLAVRLVLPLALVLLPAFVLTAIVPLVIALTGDLLAP